MKNNVIFVHALHRTGSTHLWRLFRETSRFCCYYEPFHKHVGRMNRVSNRLLTEELRQRLKHPDTGRNYFYEYEKLLTGQTAGVPNFRDSFVYKEYCHTGENRPLKTYLDTLITSAEKGTIPFLQFNRSALRVEWFRKSYPGSLNLYLVRNPRHQWESYLSCHRRMISFFLLNDLIVSSLNSNDAQFRPLSRQIPLVRYEEANIDRQERFYQTLLPAYSLPDGYSIFFHLWYRSLITNALNGSYPIHLTRLGEDPTYREEVAQKINEYCGVELCFDGSQSGQYNQNTLGPDEMTAIEEKVASSILRSLSRPLLDRLCREGSSYRNRHFSPGAIDNLRDGKGELENSTTEIGQKKLNLMQGVVEMLTASDMSHAALRQEKEKLINVLKDMIRAVR